MAKLGTGKGAAKAQESEKTTITAPVTMNVPADMDWDALYNEADSERTVRSAAHAGVNAEQIRYVIDKMFEGGKNELAVASVVRAIDKAFKLEKAADGTDTRVSNSSVRSAGTAGGKYVIISKNGSAVFVKAPEKAAAAQTA